MADAPQNYCLDCGHVWFPHRTRRAPRCAGCGGPRVEVALSLDDAPAPARRTPPERAPAEPASALPLVLGLGVVGAALLAAAVVVAVVVLSGKPDEPAVAATTPAAPVIEPQPVATPTPTPDPEPTPELPDKPPRPTPMPPDPPMVPSEVELPKPPRPKTPDPPAPVTPPPVPPPPVPPPPVPPPPLPPVPRVRPPQPFEPPAGAAWASPWDKVGDVRARVAGVAVTKVPLETRGRKHLSPDPYLVVWVEVENVGTAAHTYRRWQPVLTGECTLRFPSSVAVPYAIFPNGSGREWFSEFAQPIPPGGPPLLESLAFARPDPNAPGDLTLTLDATRVGATGRFVLTIPHAVWARR